MSGVMADAGGAAGDKDRAHEKAFCVDAKGLERKGKRGKSLLQTGSGYCVKSRRKLADI